MGKQWKQCQTLFWGAPKSLQMVTAAMKLKDAYSLEGKLWPTNTLKSRDITLPTKVCLVKAMVLPVVMYGCESWSMKKAEQQRIDAFELWCWRRLLQVPWTARRSNQSILKKINPDWSLEGLMLTLELQYFGHLIWRADSLKKTHAGKDWGQVKILQDEIVGWHDWDNGPEFEQILGNSVGQGSLACCSPSGHKESDRTEQPNNNNKSYVSVLHYAP